MEGLPKGARRPRHLLLRRALSRQRVVDLGSHRVAATTFVSLSGAYPCGRQRPAKSARLRSDLSIGRSEKPTAANRRKSRIYRTNRTCAQAGPARSRCGLFFHLISAQVVHGNLERLRQVLRILRLVLVVQVQEIHRQTFHAAELQRRILSVPPQQFFVR